MHLSAKAEDPSQSQSGGRGSATRPSDAAALATQPVAASDGYLPLDHPDFRVGQPVGLRMEDGTELHGFLDPVYGFMDARGVKLAEGVVPAGWAPAK